MKIVIQGNLQQVEMVEEELDGICLTKECKKLRATECVKYDHCMDCWKDNGVEVEVIVE